MKFLQKLLSGVSLNSDLVQLVLHVFRSLVAPKQLIQMIIVSS